MDKSLALGLSRCRTTSNRGRRRSDDHDLLGWARIPAAAIGLTYLVEGEYEGDDDSDATISMRFASELGSHVVRTERTFEQPASGPRLHPWVIAKTPARNRTGDLPEVVRPISRNPLKTREPIHRIQTLAS